MKTKKMKRNQTTGDGDHMVCYRTLNETEVAVENITNNEE